MFVRTDEIAEYLGIADEERLIAIAEHAEALVAAALGTSTLLERSETVTIYTPNQRQKYVLELPEGPLVDIDAVTSVTQDGTAVELNTLHLVHRWAIGRALGFGVGAEIAIAWTPGFQPEDSAGVGNLPEGIRAAIIQVAGELAELPTMGKTSERIGDYAYTLGGARGGEVSQPALTPRVMELLRGWIRPRGL